MEHEKNEGRSLASVFTQKRLIDKKIVMFQLKYVYILTGSACSQWANGAQEAKICIFERLGSNPNVLVPVSM